MRTIFNAEAAEKRRAHDSFAKSISAISPCSALVVVSLMYAPIAAQQPTFRAGTRLIVEEVTVKDKDGKPIEGLTAKDFIVTEDGEPQTISFVEFQRLSNSSEPSAAPDPVTG